MKFSSLERMVILDLLHDIMGEESTDYYDEDENNNEIETKYECGFVMSEYTDIKPTLQAIYDKVYDN